MNEYEEYWKKREDGQLQVQILKWQWDEVANKLKEKDDLIDKLRVEIYDTNERLQKVMFKDFFSNFITFIIKISVLIGFLFIVYHSFYIEYYKIDVVRELGKEGIGKIGDIVDTIWK